MALKVEKQKNYTILKVQAEKLDAIIAPDVKANFVSINAEGAKNVILDLADARYCDSSGLSAILVGNRLCKTAGGKLVITGIKDPIKKLILISQLDSILSSAPTVEDGVKLFSEVGTTK